MKKNIFNICMLTMVLFSCKVSEVELQGKHSKRLKFIYKTQSDCKYPPYNEVGKPIGSDLSVLSADNAEKSSREFAERMKTWKPNGGYRIYLKYPKTLPEGITKEKIRSNKCNYYWNMVFYYYSHDEQIAILEELLTFKNDVDLAGIKVYRYKDVKIPKPRTESYTMQMDALYLFTNLVMGGYTPRFAPYPVIIDTIANEEINNNPEKIKEVFEIYKKWLEDYKINGNDNLRPPLIGSKYQWYGAELKKENRNYGFDFNDFYLKKINDGPSFPSLDIMFY